MALYVSAVVLVPPVASVSAVNIWHLMLTVRERTARESSDQTGEMLPEQRPPAFRQTYPTVL